MMVLLNCLCGDMQKSNRKDEGELARRTANFEAFVDFNCSPKRYEVIVTPRSRGISGQTMMGKPQFQALPSTFQEITRKSLEHVPVVSRR
jgi:hypothetical protein